MVKCQVCPKDLFITIFFTEIFTAIYVSSFKSALLWSRTTKRNLESIDSKESIHLKPVESFFTTELKLNSSKQNSHKLFRKREIFSSEAQSLLLIGAGDDLSWWCNLVREAESGETAYQRELTRIFRMIKGICFVLADFLAAYPDYQLGRYWAGGINSLALSILSRMKWIRFINLSEKKQHQCFQTILSVAVECQRLSTQRCVFEFFQFNKKTWYKNKF